MKTRHIAFLGITASTVLSLTLSGCSASDTTTKKSTKTGAGGSAGATGAGGSGVNPVGAGGGAIDPSTSGMGGSMGMAGAGAVGDCTAPVVTKSVVAADVLSDLEGDAPGAIMAVTPGGGWYSYQDPEVGTTFIPAPGVFMPEAGGSTVSPGHAVHVAGSGFMGPPSASNWGAGAGFSLGGGIPGGPATGSGMATAPTDVSAYTGISFYAKSSMGSDISVQFATPDTDPSYCTCGAAMLCYTTHFSVVLAVTADWKQYMVKWTDLKQPDYGGKIAFDPASLLTINFASNGPVPMFDYWVDDVTLTK